MILKDPGINDVLQFFADNTTFYHGLKTAIRQIITDTAATRKERDEPKLLSEKQYARYTHQDRSNWSPSDYAVMVDMRLKANPSGSFATAMSWAS